MEDVISQVDLVQQSGQTKKIREFVKDYPTMETEDLLKKYNLTNHYTANKYYLRFTNG